MSYCTVLSMYAFRASFVVLCEVFMVGAVPGWSMDTKGYDQTLLVPYRE